MLQPETSYVHFSVKVYISRVFAKIIYLRYLRRYVYTKEKNYVLYLNTRVCSSVVNTKYNSTRRPASIFFLRVKVDKEQK